jgi:dTDP-4-amino-4,6-dideoxygalactose transaminase
MYEIGQEEIDAVSEVIRSGQLCRYRGGEGGQADTCEKKMAALFGCEHALVVSSGTGALICGLVGLGIGPGDEVIVPAYTWLASAGAVLSVGAIPVLADVDKTLTLDPADFERRIGPRTKAVIPVHMGGRPSDMTAIQDVAVRHGLFVLEDACQAIGGSHRNKRLGSIGDAGAFSFNQFKTISCGEGGALLTNDRRVFERALYYHDMGCTFRGHAGTMTEEPFLGNTYRMNEIQCAVLRVQLDRLEGILARLRERRDWLLAAVRAAHAPVAIAPSHDIGGDCGNNATFVFNTPDMRAAVAQRAAEIEPACKLSSPIDTDLHVYTNWSMLLNRQGGFCPEMNPFLSRENQGCRTTITPDSCRNTLAILARTGSIGLDVNWSRAQCEAIARALCRAAEEAGGAWSTLD